MQWAKSPQLKKRDEYDRGCRPLLEHPHAFRKNWRKKKSREHRRDRALRSALASAGGGELTAAAVGRLRRRQQVIKSSVMTLRERVAFNHARRERVGMHRDGNEGS